MLYIHADSCVYMSKGDRSNLILFWFSHILTPFPPNMDLLWGLVNVDFHQKIFQQKRMWSYGDWVQKLMGKLVQIKPGIFWLAMASEKNQDL